MEDLVRIQDYRKYLQEQLDYWGSKNTEVKSKYAKCKIEYEDKFLPKLFNWKFENSYAGDTSWLAGRWEFFNGQVKLYKSEINRCVYQEKIGHKLVTVGNNFYIKDFYKWCSENNIPY